MGDMSGAVGDHLLDIDLYSSWVIGEQVFDPALDMHRGDTIDA
jgi:hypothetical protein